MATHNISSRAAPTLFCKHIPSFDAATFDATIDNDSPCLPRKMSQGQRNMAIFDKWQPDEDSRSCCEDSKIVELDFDPSHWSHPEDESKSTSYSYLLRLEEMNQFSIEARLQSRNRNLARVKVAKKWTSVLHLDAHYTCCVDPQLREAIEELVNHDERKWCSFTMMGMNGLDFYATPTVTEDLCSFFESLHAFRILNLHSWTLNRGHGLESILKSIPHLLKLRVLRLEGWQMDRVSIKILVESMRHHNAQSIRHLSLRSNRFQGGESFRELVEGLRNMPTLEILNISYCDLSDTDVIPLVKALQEHPKIAHVHLGGNFCHSERSVEAVANWIKQPSCILKDLNLRSLWIGFTEDGLVQRFVDLVPLFEALSENRSISNLSLSENYLEDMEVQRLSQALLSRKNQSLRFLDVGDNPFGQSGAEILVDLVRKVPNLQQLRFENAFTVYRVAGLVRLLTQSNRYDELLVNKAVNVVLPLWPRALAKVQRPQNSEEATQDESLIGSHLFRLLRSQTGVFGHELSFRIAAQATQK